MIESSVSNVAMAVRAQQGQNHQSASQIAAQDREQQIEAAASEPVSTSGVSMAPDQVSISSQPSDTVTRTASSTEAQGSYSADRDDDLALQEQVRQIADSKPSEPYNTEAEAMLGTTIDIQS